MANLIFESPVDKVLRAYVDRGRYDPDSAPCDPEETHSSIYTRQLWK